MSLDDIEALPVAEWAAPDCALFLWAIDPMLPQASDVMAAWVSTTVKNTRWSGAATRGPR